MKPTKLKLATNKVVTCPEGDVIYSTELITPEIAKAWLGVNFNNRAIRPSKVLEIARDIQAGRWRLNGETIKIAEDESIMDGQHRLHAIIEAGVAVYSAVVYGIHPDAFDTVDTGTVRSSGDVVKLHYQAASNGLCNVMGIAAQWSHKIRNGITSKMAREGLRNGEILAYIAARPKLWPAAESVRSWARKAPLIPHGAAAALLYHFQEYDAELGNIFVGKVLTGVDIEANDVERHLRNFLLDDKMQRYSSSAPTKVMMTIKAWNLKREGRRVRSANPLKIVSGEKAPVIS